MYTVQSYKKFGVTIFLFILSRFSIVSNTMIFFIHSLNRFVCFFFLKCLHVAGFLQLGALYANIRYDPRSEYHWRKSERSERQRSWGVIECSETPAEVLGGGAR